MRLSWHVAFASALGAWFQASARDLPWRAPDYGPWGVLVSECMLQQTQVSRVIPVIAEWLRRWPTPVALASVPAGEAVRAWGRLGYPRRALRLHAAALAIVERHGGQVPRSVEELLALPGVGTYTARAVAAFAFGVRTPVVDTNVRRVLARAVLGQGEAGPASVRRDLALMESVLPQDAAQARIVNAAVMELGAVICTARTPDCGRCPVQHECAWRRAGHPPYHGPRARTQARFEGSDRQLRGIVLAHLRASEIPLPREELGLPREERSDHVIAGLVRDGLVVADDDGYRLPG